MVVGGFRSFHALVCLPSQDVTQEGGVFKMVALSIFERGFRMVRKHFGG